MTVKFDIVDVLWAALRGIDASKDARRRSPPVLRVEREIMRAIAELNAAKSKQERVKRAANETDDAA